MDENVFHQAPSGQTTPQGVGGQNMQPLQGAGTPPVGTPPRAPVGYGYTPPPAKVWAADKKDRALLFLALGIGALLACLLLSPGLPGLGVTVAVAAWYAVAIWYLGWEGFHEKPSLLLFAAVAALALTFSLFSNLWLRVWNALFLCGLMAVQLFQWSGQGKRLWSVPSMLLERLCLLCRGLFCNLPAPLAAVKSFRGGDNRRTLAVGAGLLVAVPLLIVAGAMLASADAYFDLVAGRALNWLADTIGEGALRVFLGLLAAPFLFGLLYFLRRGEGREAGEPALPLADPAAAVVVLGALDLLYAFFIAVQSAALFGGEAYLRDTGLTYAEYARRGFFQLVFVAVMNLAVVMLALQFSRHEGGGWRGVQVLSTAMVAMSCVMLVSAAWRMTLYVMVYGLSFKRFLTYWGMVMLAVFFAAALGKIWRAKFSFFKVLLVGGIVGWLILNYCNVDFIVARYNVSLYLRQENSVMNLDYLLFDLSYDALWPLADLPGDTVAGYDQDWLEEERKPYTLEDAVARRRAQAAKDASHWETWSVSAALAAGR